MSLTGAPNSADRLLGRRRWCAGALAAATLPARGARAGRRVLVGPGREVATLAQAAALARPGDRIEVDPGTYRGDVAVWRVDDVTIRCGAGRAELQAAGEAAERKAIWVVRAAGMIVENFDFTGAQVADANGAGIRFEQGSLTVRRCRFLDNENGILTGNRSDAALRVEDCEFGHNGAGDGYSHNLYAGTIDSLWVSGSHFHHARVGHLLKSRARENRVLFNRLVDGTDGEASYELEFPSGGIALAMGNLIRQSPRTRNATLVSFGAEGYSHRANSLALIHNTLVDDRGSGAVALRTRAGAHQVALVNNLLVGEIGFDGFADADLGGNFSADRREFAAPAAGDYRLRAASRLAGRAVALPALAGIALPRLREHAAPAGTRLPGPGPASPGAMQSLAGREG
jgi:hypothetical protein